MERQKRQPPVILPCTECNNDVKVLVSQLRRKDRKTQNVFCDITCRNTYNNKTYKIYTSGPDHGRYKDGKSIAYRYSALKRLSHECSNENCPLRLAGIEVVKELLDADHIDGNRENNDPSNIQLLCVFCHAVKTRLG